MNYSIKDKFIFFHVPKTAGTSIHSCFNGNLRSLYSDLGVNYERLSGFLKTIDTHVSASEVKSKLGLSYNEYFTFAFVRNPWDWKVSLYKFICKRKNHQYHELYKGYKDFTDYIKNTEYEVDTSMNTRLQSEYIFDNNELILDYVGRFENLQEDFDIICDKIGIPRKQLPHKNKSKRRHYTEYYDEEAKQIVAEKYAKDIEYFGYKFEE